MRSAKTSPSFHNTNRILRISHTTLTEELQKSCGKAKQNENKNKSGFNNKKSKNRETTPVNPAFIHKIFISIYFFIRPMPTHPSRSDNEFPIPKPPSCAF